MKNKYFLFCLLLTCAFAFCSCGMDLSHKHYLNEFGFCRQCQKDLSISMKFDGEKYVSEEVNCPTNDYTYFKFVANSASHVTIYLEEITASVESYNLHLYKEGSYGLSLWHDVENNSFRYENPLTQGDTYFVKVKASAAGKIRLSVQFTSYP